MSLDPGLTAAYADAADGFMNVARLAAADRASWDHPTECPGWTVGDVVAHVVGLERDLDGWPRPEHELPADLPHVTSELDRWMEVPVDLRRGRPPSGVLAELEEVLPQRKATVAELVATGEDVELAGLGGVPTRAARLLPMRVLDLWAHEQDIRRALGIEGHLACPAADTTAALIRSTLPEVVATRAAVGPGNVVRLVVEGQTALQAVVEVRGNGRGELVDPRGRHGVPTVDIDLDWETLVRLACGRVSYADVAEDIYLEGNRAAGVAILNNLALTP